MRLWDTGDRVLVLVVSNVRIAQFSLATLFAIAIAISHRVVSLTKHTEHRQQAEQSLLLVYSQSLDWK